MIQRAAPETPVPDATLAHPTGRLSHGARWALGLAWLLAIGALFMVMTLSQRVGNLQEQLARQTADAMKTAIEARTLARHADEQVQSASAKVAALEGRVGDLVAYRDKMETLVQSVVRARDENVVVELEAALRFAQDQAQLTGSPRPLLAALHTAETRLSQGVDPRLAPVSQAVARDLDRMQNARFPDTAGLLARIEQVQREADTLPLGKGREGAGGTPPEQTVTAPANASWWTRVRLSISNGFCRIFRCSGTSVDLRSLQPDQIMLIRQNLRLRLEGARLGLLARQYASSRADLDAARVLVQNWFDPTSPRTQAVVKTLSELQDLVRAPDWPDISDTLAALRKLESAGND